METINKLTKLLENNMIEEAHDLFLANEEILKDNSEYWNLRGFLYTRIQEYALATKCFKNAIDVDISNFEAHYNYAYVLEQEEKFDKAAIHYGLAYKYTKDEELQKSMENLFENHDGLRSIFLSVAKGKNKTFIITSNVKWGIVYQRHHHIARALVKLGYEVYYIETPIESEFPSSTIDKNMLNMVSKEYKIIDGVKICTTFEGTFNGEVIESNYLDMISYIVESIDRSKEVVFLNYNTHIIDFLKNIKRNNKHIIYECVDDNTDIDYAFWSNDKSIYDEQKAIELSDHVVTTSTTLYIKHAIAENRNNVSLIRNAVNKEDFVIEEDIILDDIANIPKPRVCYTGALYSRLDTELLFSTAKNNPKVSFVVIGFGDESLMKDSPTNIYYLGPKKHSELKYYLKQMDIGVIPFKTDMIGVSCCDSIKHYEYLAAGIPVITTAMPESGIEKPYTYMVSNEMEFTEAIKKAIDLNVDKNVIIDFLYSNSWLNRAADISLIFESTKINAELKNENIKNRLTNLVDKYPSNFHNILLDIFKNRNYKNLEKNLMFKDSYIDQIYLKFLLKNKNFKKLTEYLYKILDGDTINIIKGINNEEHKNQLILYLGYILTKEYFSAGITFKKLDKEFVNKLISNNKLNKSLRNYTEKAIKNYFEAELKQSKYKLYLIDLNNTVAEDFKYKLCSNLNNITTINKANILEFCKSTIIENFEKDNNIKVIVPFDDNFVKAIRIISDSKIKSCYVAAEVNNYMVLTEINEEILKSVRNKEYLKTISIFKQNSADGNVEAVIRNIPEHLKDIIKIRVISPDKIYSLEESIITPLLSSITISGFAVFGNYPKHTYNIELWHGGLGLKTCGLMDKVNKSSGGTIECFEKIDKICLASYMNCVQFTACFAIPENKYEITGLPRTDLLLNSNSRGNLEKLLNIDAKDKKIIFNMPTFHLNSNSNRIEGNSALSDYFKMPDFNYIDFNKFLKENNMICISKAHHNEESLLSENKATANLENLYFINNKMLEEAKLNLYDILGGADLLITDYSSAYGDFLFMDKPTVFSIYDIDEYRESRGIALEPFDFWTAGPKVKSQDELQKAILDCNKDEFKKQRKDLQKVFFKYLDNQATNRVWDVIENALKDIN